MELVREPIGLRVLICALRPEDGEPFRLWRADPQDEIDALVAAGQDEAPAALWAALLRWSEAEAVSSDLIASGWRVTLQGVRAIVLPRAVSLLQPPAADTGWPMNVAGLTLRAVPETPGDDDEILARLLAFLDSS
jgi:hypothetical protein